MDKKTKDIFYQKLHDYGTLQLIADAAENTATLQLTNGAYALPVHCTIAKSEAFELYNNSCIQTYEEIRNAIIALR